MARALIGLIGLVINLSPAVAADLRDPTQPPPGFAAAGDPAAAPPPAAKLTSVMLRPGGHSLAIVDGVAVRVGDSLAEGRITRIDEGGIWLRTDAGPKRIGLLPAVAKTPRMEKKAPADTQPAAKMEKTK